MLTKRIARALSVALSCLALLGCDFSGLPVAAPTVSPSTPTPGPAAVSTLPAPTLALPSATIVETPVETPAGASVSPVGTPLTTAGTTSEIDKPACTAGPGASQSSIGDPFYPGLGNAGYDAQHYTLDLAVDVAANAITGTTMMSARAAQNLNAFNLDLDGLQVSRILVNGATAAFDHQGKELVITPTAPLASGEVFTTTTTYGGVPNKASSGSSTPAEGWMHFSSGIYVGGEPTGASTWYPVNEHPCDKASYTIRVTAPEPYVVAANGLLENTTDQGNSRTYLFEERYPVASYLVTVDIADFDRQQTTGPGGLPIRNYFPHDVGSDERNTFAGTPQMIEYFSSIFGPYPFDVYGVVVADETLGFALETQTMSLFGKSSGRAGRTSPEEVVAHELSHQWFGDSVSLTEWKDIWLNEGFATYAQWLWLEHTQGRAALDQRVRQTYTYLSQQSLPPPGDPPSSNLFNDSVYLRGGLTLHALRLKVGDDAFFRIMKTYAERYKYGNARTQDFISVAEEVSGQNLNSLFQGWLYSTTMPPLPTQ